MDSSESALGAEFFLDILNKKMYNINRVGENVTSIEEYDVATITVSNDIYTPSGLSLVGTMHYSFDSNGKQFRKKYVAADGSEQKYVFEYQDEQNVAVQLPTGVVSHAKSDHLGRKIFDELQLGKGLLNRTFTYHEGEISQTHLDNDKQVSKPETTLVKQIEFADGRTIQYEYDAEERITQVIDTMDSVETKTEYTYDALGQLLTETVNGELVTSMEYDNYGNITKKNGVVYSYDTTWKDLLISYNGQEIKYDDQGNPKSYLGHTLTWEKGRQLKKFVKSDGTVIDYTYNANGIRTSKKVNGVLHTYTLDGTKILRETWDGNTLIPLYDNEDGVCGILYNSVPYYFIKNLQGDVIAIVDKDAKTVARYSYDAWGGCTVTQDTSGCSIATINPFRYRSYYFDQEIGLYYLQSRYYDASVGRFINLDTPEVVTSINTPKNLFEYCGNNPINEKDPSGNAVVTTILKFIAGLFFGFLTQLSSDFIVYLYDRFIKSKEHSIISSSLGDYVGASLSCGASMILPISGKHWKLFVAIGNIIPFLTKYLCILFSNGFNFNAIKILDFVIDLASLLINILVSIYLGNKLKKKLDTLKKKRIANSKNTKLKLQKKEIKISFNKLGIKASFSIILSAAFLQTLLKIFVGG